MEARDKVDTEAFPAISSLKIYRSTKLCSKSIGMALWIPAKAVAILLDVTMIYGKTIAQQMWTAQRENTHLTVAEEIDQILKISDLCSLR